MQLGSCFLRQSQFILHSKGYIGDRTTCVNIFYKTIADTMHFKVSLRLIHKIPTKIKFRCYKQFNDMTTKSYTHARIILVNPPLKIPLKL